MAGTATTFDGTSKIVRKHPNASQRFEFDFANKLVTGQTLSGTPVVTADVAGLTIGAPTISGTKVYVTISAGTAGKIYTLTCDCPTATPTETLTINGGISVNNPQ